jgi:glycerol uptake facilitator-like aquaporin
VTADILVGGPLTGAAMNPARWFGPAVAAGYFDNWYVWWIGPLLGGGVAAALYRWVLAPDEPVA